MIRHVLLLSVALLFAKGSILFAQTTILSAGGEINGSGGSGSYSVGQVFFSATSGAQGSVIQGVQQPYEVSVVTAIQNTEEILLECNVFPNPTFGKITLRVETDFYRDLRYQLFDSYGKLIREMKIGNNETEIAMDDLKSSTYFLKVLSKNRELKTFKIIKH